MIRLYSHEMLRLWNRGDLQVQLDVPHRRLPMGYCDGTDDDEAELRAMAEEEGVSDLPIHKRVLKTGRQIWTLGLPRVEQEDVDEDL